jgi:hypothetical protein
MTYFFSGATNDIIQWHENDGSESFTQHDIDLQSYANFFRAADLDQDGHIDVVAVTNTTVKWYRNNGNGASFTEITINSAGDSLEEFDVIDLDEDGDLDIIAPDADDNIVIWYENDGSENFNAHTIPITITGANFVKVADLDKDGDLDVIVRRTALSSIVWLENDGAENFTLHSFNLPSSAGVQDIVPVFFNDGNTAIDIVTLNLNLNEIISYEAANCIGGSLPVITNLNPLDNATGVSDSANLVMSFSENVIADSGNILIRLMSDNSIVESIPVGDPRVTGTGTNTISRTPQAHSHNTNSSTVAAAANTSGGSHAHTVESTRNTVASAHTHTSNAGGSGTSGTGTVSLIPFLQMNFIMKL